MKRLLLITLVLLVVLGGLGTTAWHYLPTLGSYLLGKAINGSVEAAGFRVGYDNGLILIDMKGVRMRGNVEGTLESCEIRLVPTKGMYVKYFSASDFDITVKREKGKVAFYPVPVELAEIRKGLLSCGGQKFIVRELRITNFNTGKKLEFSIDGGIEGLGNVKTRGEGIFGEKRSDVKGDFFSRV